MSLYWQDEQITYDLDTYTHTPHTHRWSIDIEVVPDAYLDAPVAKRAFAMEQRVFAYCDCGASLNEKEICNILNKETNQIE